MSASHTIILAVVPLTDEGQQQELATQLRDYFSQAQPQELMRIADQLREAATILEIQAMDIVTFN